jgi:malonate decarboxylase beta subunit
MTFPLPAAGDAHGLEARAISYAECTARERLAQVFDAGSFHEWLPPAERLTSPHLAQLGVPSAFDDGVAIGRALLDGHTVFVAAQEGEFMGGGVGEVHGAKLVGLLQRALRDHPAAVLLLAESGGVRLHEANAGLIAVSEVMRAVLDVRAAGIPVIVLIGGANGCFGGMGIVARCADHIVMSDMGRLAMSGPEVIEASHGVDEYDARDRALVWRTSGGKHRWISGDCDALVEDDVAAFRTAAIAALQKSRPVTLQALQSEHALLAARLAAVPEASWNDGAEDDAVRLWRSLGVADAPRVPALDVAALQQMVSPRSA